MGRVRRALRDAERKGLVPPGTVEEYTNRAKGGNYDNLLAVTMEYVDEPTYDEDEPDYGGAFDGNTVYSDADPGL
jgi:hypothetical protein